MEWATGIGCSELKAQLLKWNWVVYRVSRRLVAQFVETLNVSNPVDANFHEGNYSPLSMSNNDNLF